MELRGWGDAFESGSSDAPTRPDVRLAHELDGLRYQQALQAGRIGTWWLDRETRVAQWDAISSDILGLEGSDSPLKGVIRLHPDDETVCREALERSFQQGSVFDAEYRPLRPDGQTRWVRAIARPSATSGFGARWLTGVMFDVTDRRLAEDALRESRRQLSILLNNLPGVAYRCEARAPWQMDFISSAVEEMTGYPPEAFAAPDMAWANLMHPDDVDAVSAAVAEGLATRTAFSVRYRIIDRSGAVKWVHERGEASFDEHGQPQFIEGFIWDVSEQQAADERLQWAALHDGLTGLPNRILFQQRLEQAIERSARDGGQVGILLIDLDDFKTINDTLGHDAGDSFLRSVAERVSLSIRPGDIVARMGGDEFAVLVDERANRSIIQRTATKIMACFEEPFAHEERLFDGRASLGLNILTGSGTTRAALMKNADIALYAAKAEGGGRMKFYQPHMRSEMEDRAFMLQRAREALQNDWIVPHYQPKIDLITGRISGFEALLRWQHPTDGLQAPETIAAAFQDLDVASALSDRMIDLVIADIARWERRGLSFGHVALNAAAAEFRRGDFPEALLRRLGDARIAPGRFQIEVTESVFLGRGAECVETALTLLSSAGVAVALDDFGTGYASLSHLKQFPVDAIKIDRSFIRDLEDDPDDAAIVRALVGLGKSLGIQIVAEGIETEQQAAYLRTLGCDFGQGFLFGAPIPGRDVPALIGPASNRPRRAA